MKKAQQVLSQFLEQVPPSQFASEDDQIKFDRLRQKLAGADDLGVELRSLYKVRGFSDLALSLLWVAERVEKDAARLEILPEEETLVKRQLGIAFGESVPTVTPEIPTELLSRPAEEVFPTPPAPIEEPPTASVEVPQTDQPAIPPEVSPAPLPVATGAEGEFAALVEKFVEAMQGGDDTRNDLMNQVRQQAEGFAGGGSPEMLQQYCRHLLEFLSYVEENQFMDDVRVMNILSNITSPLSQWAAAAPDQRSGLLDEGVATLMDFKSLFE
ncbi:MAG TPA: hypothetical protein VNN76_04640 [Bacteroidota bacterium]|nr:hypothetical protein [Bacteroidota bacterium]